MIREIQFAPSTFMIDRDDTKMFQGDQADYRKQSSIAIGEALKKVQVCEKTEEKLSALFFELLSDFGDARRNIALSHGTEGAKNFGKRREDLVGYFSTPLDDVYKVYNLPILRRFARALQPYAAELEKEDHKKIKVIEESVFKTYASSFEVEVFEASEVAKKNLISPPLPDDFPEDLLTEMVNGNELKPDKYELLRKALAVFYCAHQGDCTKDMLSYYVQLLHKRYPYITKAGWSGFITNDANLKSFYALGTLRLQVEEKPVVASYYLVWLHRDGKTPPLARMLQHTICTVIHQPTFLVQTTLQEVSKLFAKAVLSNNKELKDCIGLFRAYFTHPMPFNRGSAAVAEYFETLLYHYQGIQLTYNNNKMVDLEAFTTPLLADFMAEYDSMIKLY